MMPTIGIGVMLYVWTRCLSFIQRKGDRSETPMVKGMAVITALYAMFAVFVLFTTGVSM